MLNNLIEKWSESFQFRDTTMWLKIALYAIVIYSIVGLGLPIHDQLWGADSLIAPLKFPDLFSHQFIMLLHKEEYQELYPVFMLMAIVGIALSFWSRWPSLGALMVFIAVEILFNRTYSFLTGGNYLLHILLFYLIFIDGRSQYTGLKAKLSNILSHFGLWACRIQVIIVYVFTLAFKLAGEKWRAGEAVYHITHVDEFTLPWFEASIAEVHWLMVIANYAAMLYFFSFPVLVWSKRWKLKMLLIGALFHLSLGVIIGVFDFSLVMIASYISFLDDETIKKLKTLLPGKKRTLAHH